MKKNSNQMSAPTAKLVRLGDNAYITVVMNGESLTMRQTESETNFKAALDAIKNKNWDALYQAMRPVKTYINKVDGVEIRDNAVYWNGAVLHSVLANRIMDFALSGLDHKPLCKFLVKLMQNPSSRAVNELYTFLEHKNLPITDNGNILAYKGVRKDYWSITAGATKLLKGRVNAEGRIYNGVGEEIECERNSVNDNADIGCSYGLHAGNESYAVDFGRYGRVVVVEINPKDVVSIPKDFNFQKLRTCAYKVVEDYSGTLTEPLYESNWNNDEDHIDEDYYDDCCDGDCTCCSDDVEYECEVAFDCPKSSWIDYIEWYNNDSLWIYCSDGGEIVYEDVPKSVAADYQNYVNNGGSSGVYYNRKIKGKYTER